MKKNNNHHYLSYGHFSFVRDLTYRKNLYFVKDLPQREGGDSTYDLPDGMPAIRCQDWRLARVCVTLPA